jgi:hypothetical protein
MTDEDYFTETLDEMKDWAFSIAAEWNGDDSGIQEDRATQAEHICRIIDNLQEEIKEMEELRNYHAIEDEDKEVL